MHRSIFIALAALAAGRAAAEELRRPDPVEPRAEVPAVEYRSAFAGYRPFAEEKVAPWRDSNEAVKDGEEHASHAATPPAPAEPAKPPAIDKHGGHR